MATLTFSLSGSALTNISQSYIIDDADIQSVLDWGQSAFATQLSTAPTNQQILLAWIQGWVNTAKSGVQLFQTPPPVVPAPITFS